MSLRLRIFTAFFLLSTTISLALSYTLFAHMRENHIETLHRDLTMIASVTAQQINGDVISDNAGDHQSYRQIVEAIASKTGVYRAFLVSMDGSRYLWESISPDDSRASDRQLTGYGTVINTKGEAVAFLGVEADAATVNQDIRHLATQMLFIALVAVGLIGLGSFFLAQTFTRKIDALEVALTEIATGKYDTSLEVDGREETARLARRINELAVNLHNRRTELLVSAIEALVTALEAKDAYTYGHSSEVATIAVRIAENLRLSEEELFKIKFAALLHDIGKIGIPDHILNKRGPLNDEERACIRQHPGLGAKIIAGIPALRDISEIVLHHHARWDGRGYPAALAGAGIPLGARIIAIADTYQAMTSDRPYRRGMFREEAMAEICRCSGTQFDPALVAVFRSSGYEGRPHGVEVGQSGIA